MRLAELLATVPEAQVCGDTRVEVRGLAYDSRRVQPGDLFVTWAGSRHDGHVFCPEALQRGAVGCLVGRPGVVPPPAVEVFVPDPRAAMARVAAAFYRHPSRDLAVVGITGTKGKTTTAHLTRHVLSTLGPVGVIGTVGSIVGGQLGATLHTTPESIDLQAAFRGMVDAGDRFAVLEVSSHALELHRVDDSRFDTAVFTNLGRDHLDFHGTIERYAAAKGRLFTTLARAAVANADDAFWHTVVGDPGVPVLTYGCGTDVRVRAVELRPHTRGTDFTCLSPGGRTHVTLRLPGRFNVYNALAALTVGVAYGVEPAAAAEALAHVRGVPGRFELVECGQPFSVVVDYAHTPDSLEQMLQAARELTPRRVILVFGAGGDRDRGKRPLMGAVAARWADVVVVTSDNPRSEDPAAIIAEIEAGVRSAGGCEHHVLADRAAAIRLALGAACPDDVVLIAGKGHETYQIFADRTVHFDDRAEARDALRELGY